MADMPSSPKKARVETKVAAFHAQNAAVAASRAASRAATDAAADAGPQAGDAAAVVATDARDAAAVVVTDAGDATVVVTDAGDAAADAAAASCPLLRAVETFNVEAVIQLLPGSAALLNPEGEDDPSVLLAAVKRAVDLEQSGDTGAAARALQIVELVVGAGANLFGCAATLREINKVVEAFVPETSECAEHFAPIEDYGPYLLTVMGGSVPCIRIYPYDMAPRLPLFLALEKGSPGLVKLLLTDDFCRKSGIVWDFFNEGDEYEGQWTTLWGYVAWMRSDADPAKVAVLELLWSMRTDWAAYESDTPGCLGTQYPLLHGLVARDAGTKVSPALAAFVRRIVCESPGLLSTYNRDNRTAYVEAARLGLLGSLRLLDDAVAALPPDVRGGINLLNPTSGMDDFQDPSDVDMTEDGVCIVNEDDFCPVQAIVAAALHGHLDVVTYLLALLRKWLQSLCAGAAARCTEHACMHDGVPFTLLLVQHASEMESGPARDRYCDQLEQVLRQSQDLGPALVDMDGNSVLHVAVHLQVPAVVRAVLKAVGSDLALVARKNDAKFTARTLANKIKKAARVQLLTEHARVVKVRPHLVAAARRLLTARAVLKALSN
jgi:hypothetical protein